MSDYHEQLMDQLRHYEAATRKKLGDAQFEKLLKKYGSVEKMADAGWDQINCGQGRFTTTTEG